MDGTFAVANAFNSELAWDTSKVTDMNDMFFAANAFNQPLVWDTSKVTEMHTRSTTPGPSTRSSTGTRAR